VQPRLSKIHIVVLGVQLELTSPKVL